jgi:phage terminase small subunit
VSQGKPTQHEMEMTDEQKRLFGALTSMQQNICIESLSGKNDIDSYYAGGGKAKTRLSAEAAASTLLSNVKVKAFMGSMKHEAVKGAVMTRQEMLERLSVLARVNMSDLIEWSKATTTDAEGEEVEQSTWALKESSELDQYKLAAIAEVTSGRDGFKIKQHSPLAAMKQLADVEGYNAATKNEITGKDGGAIETADMTERQLARRIAFTLAKGAREK